MYMYTYYTCTRNGGTDVWIHRFPMFCASYMLICGTNVGIHLKREKHVLHRTAFDMFCLIH